MFTNTRSLSKTKHNLVYRMGQKVSGEKIQCIFNRDNYNDGVRNLMMGSDLPLPRKSWASECPDVKNYKWRLNPVWHRMLYSCTHMATVGFKGLKQVSTSKSTTSIIRFRNQTLCDDIAMHSVGRWLRSRCRRAIIRLDRSTTNRQRQQLASNSPLMDYLCSRFICTSSRDVDKQQQMMRRVWRPVHHAGRLSTKKDDSFSGWYR